MKRGERGQRVGERENNKKKRENTRLSVLPPAVLRRGFFRIYWTREPCRDRI